MVNSSTISAAASGERHYRYLLLVQLIASSIMMGLIWVVQLVHYPAFAYIDPQRFTEFQQFHMAAITFIVAPSMFAEAIGCLACFYYKRDRAQLLSIVLLAVVWFSTALVQVPVHDQLLSGKDAAAIEWLVCSNWLRTIAWTARAGLTGWLCAQLLTSRD